MRKGTQKSAQRPAKVGTRQPAAPDGPVEFAPILPSRSKRSINRPKPTTRPLSYGLYEKTRIAKAHKRGAMPVKRLVNMRPARSVAPQDANERISSCAIFTQFYKPGPRQRLGQN